MRIEAFLQQSPIFQTSRIARRMDASLNLVLQDEGVTAFEALVLAARRMSVVPGLRVSQVSEAMAFEE